MFNLFIQENARYTVCYEVNMATLSVLLGNRIREIRESKNIKQNKLAEMLNIEPTNLSKLEKGVHLPKEETINKLAEALGCNLQDLFNFEHFKNRDDLIQSIDRILHNAKTEELQYFYKMLTAYKELK